MLLLVSGDQVTTNFLKTWLNINVLFNIFILNYKLKIKFLFIFSSIIIILIIQFLIFTNVLITSKDY
ncbi:hypothetical protein GLOIN_2v1551533 [Rhizophagus irregularis DAOM 181602=DAOM 197198]|uniref:Uncharacterized protein n=1 Tax=Rhizophagus irregularis (strain DAOM 181602 / DAOM 197198 / MUCL 43194) TaxID=747089 RepID=A0A2P4QH31_RHIID|nr:hypothetical protein GLOIN_2v1551533 [Rhizophagus irregularis DAOM 181602=DAOM 197198]POG76934.1 hypothetical protein GLOIN_2v1551533 [Rhizophagus irregularis DAOM 181602=DAOM 197198]GET58548.1 hypothetical protein GLOIN_2v1551533 [Rhizophagus irregularis DAOM 181602=DAOM 197198]|eukprot:XP_025183800.1 hypothetical protein GLOIN_2v1551533 [Rhizophagus irregularis DAOM 181602=DAOM 197198]